MEKCTKEGKIFIANTAEEIKMVFDPYRLRILKALHSKEVEMTVKQIAVELGEAPNKVHYHVKKLVDFGILELVRTENINGILAKYYKTSHIGYIIGGGQENTQEVLSARENAVMNAIDDAVSKFKKDTVSYINLVAEQGEEAQRGLTINYSKIYMTKEEKETFVEQLNELLKKYSEEDADKEIYTMIQTLARIK